MPKGIRQTKWQLVLIGAMLLIGILLMLFGGGSGTETDKTGGAAQDWQQYILSLEEKAVQLCERVAGVSDVTVAISLVQGIEYVYAEGERSYSSAEAVLLTERPPQINGIGVVCSGAENPTVQERLTSLLSAAFGVGSHRIYITSSG